VTGTADETTSSLSSRSEKRFVQTRKRGKCKHGEEALRKTWVIARRCLLEAGEGGGKRITESVRREINFGLGDGATLRGANRSIFRGSSSGIFFQ